jgi:hypothetical protein
VQPPEPSPDAAAVEQALRSVQLAYDQAAALIESMPDPQHAFERATDLREATDELVGQAAELRARMAGRVWDAEKMSLASLADRIGVSKSRADQFLRIARTGPNKREES